MATNYLIVQFYDHGSAQITDGEDAAQTVLTYATSDANRLECVGLGATGQVQNYRITLPKFQRELWSDVNDKVTPLFKVEGFNNDDNTMLVWVNVKLRGYTYKAPDVIEVVH